MTTTRLLVMCGLATTLAIGAYSGTTSARQDAPVSVVEVDPFDGFAVTTEGLFPREIAEATRRAEITERALRLIEDERDLVELRLRGLARAEPSGDFRPAIIQPTELPQFGGWMDTEVRGDFAEPYYPDRPELYEPLTVDQIRSAMTYNGNTFASAAQPILLNTKKVIVMLRVRDIGDFRFEGGDVKSMAPVLSYRENEEGEVVKKSGRASHSVMLRRSITDEGLGVEEWFRDTNSKSPGRDAVIAFYDNEGNELRVYELTGVYPKSLSLNDRGGLGEWGEEIVLTADAIRRSR